MFLKSGRRHGCPALKVGIHAVRGFILEIGDILFVVPDHVPHVRAIELGAGEARQPVQEGGLFRARFTRSLKLSLAAIALS